MVEGNSLENCRAGNGSASSNLALSAKKKDDHLVVFFLASERDPNSAVVLAKAKTREWRFVAKATPLLRLLEKYVNTFLLRCTTPNSVV